MSRLGSLAIKAIGALVVAVIVLSVIATLVGIAFSVVSAIISMILTLAILAGVVLGAAWLVSWLWGSDTEPVRTNSSERVSTESRDPHSRLQDRYVAGELTEAEFERELDRLMEADGHSNVDRTTATDLERDRL